LVAGDRKPSLVHTLKDTAGTVIDLNAVSNAFFRMTNMKTDIVALNDVTATISDATAGIVTYNWAAGDTSVPGMYAGDWKLIYDTGEIYHIKNPFWVTIREP
ncbi:MAG: hypothetical protein KKD44_27290, partial [Proteobacteria bacterium]|nr:hypothetical protein [Pseudomonadota bacterium]